MNAVEREEADWSPLGEDVSLHTMLGFYQHYDGRTCSYHSRLGAWAFGWPADKKCLRSHDEVGDHLIQSRSDT